MSGYIEKKIISGKTYYYLTETKRIDGKWKKTRKYLGVNTPAGFEKPRKDAPKPILSKEQITVIEKIKQEYNKEHKISTLWDEDKGRLIEFIYNTNAIEGNTLTLEETTRVLKGEKIKHNPRDVKEVLNMKECIDFLLTCKGELTEDLILKLHAIEMKEIMHDAGQFRTVDVRVANYICPPHEKVPKLIKNFVTWYNEVKDKMHVFELAGLVHLKFVRIHPFRDGNGRMARLLHNLILLQNKYPLLNIFNKEKLLYYLILQEVDFKKKHAPFIKYLYEVYAKQYST